MPVMVLRRCHISPSTTCDCPEEARPCNNFGQSRVRLRSEDIPEEDEGESRAGSDGDEDLEDRALRIAVANCGRYGWEPFIRVAIVFVLHDLAVVKPASHYQSAQECTVRHGSMSP